MAELLPFIIPGILLFIAGIIISGFSSGRFRAPLGFRSSLSMKNMDVWRASNRVFGLSIISAGILSILLGLIIFYFFNDVTGIVVIMILSFISIFISYYYTDTYIKDYYDDSGFRIK